MKSYKTISEANAALDKFLCREGYNMRGGKIVARMGPKGPSCGTTTTDLHCGSPWIVFRLAAGRSPPLGSITTSTNAARPPFRILDVAGSC